MLGREAVLPGTYPAHASRSDGDLVARLAQPQRVLGRARPVAEDGDARAGESKRELLWIVDVLHCGFSSCLGERLCEARVTAPSDADETSATYFPMTPRV